MWVYVSVPAGLDAGPRSRAKSHGNGSALDYKAPPMPQKPIVRRRQKARRSRQLAEWRAKQAEAQAASPSSKSPKPTKPAAK